jgi:hypothetical protein
MGVVRKLCNLTQQYPAILERWLGLPESTRQRILKLAGVARGVWGDEAKPASLVNVGASFLLPLV